jgi:hypothetical protein
VTLVGLELKLNDSELVPVKFPEQYSISLGGAVITGLAVTVTDALAEPVQLPFEATKLYVVEAVGVTTIEDVVAPVDQLYDVSPEPDAVRVVEVPWQTVRVPVILTLGADVTTIARVVVAVQPLVPVPVIV